jgi:hypothetical protein
MPNLWFTKFLLLFILLIYITLIHLKSEHIAYKVDFEIDILKNVHNDID